MTFNSLARKAVLASATCALAVCMVPASAFAAVHTNDDGKVTYELPTDPISLQQELTDADGNTYTQEYLSVAKVQPPMQQPYYSLLGVNNTGLGRTIVSGGNTETQYGLFGSDANECPDTYLYNYCCTLNGTVVPSDMVSSSASTTVNIDGTDYNMPADIYHETNIIVGGAATSTTSGKTYAEWVALENQRTGRSKTGEYNPTYASFSLNSGSAYTMTESLYSMADTCDEIIEASADENGNYTLATRYAIGPTTHSVVNAYEDIVKGTQYYILSKIADNTIEKATVAVVCGYDPSTKNYACRVVNTGIDNDYDSNVYAGRFSTAIAAIANDITELGLKTAQDAFKGTVTTMRGESEVDESDYVRWYTAEQIEANCDAVLVTDAPAGNSVSSYLATASDKMPHTVSENMEGLKAAKADLEADGLDAADLCYNWPASLFGVYYAQGCENVVLSLVGECFLYPDVMDLTDVMAYWAKNVWHIKDGALQDIVDSTCYGVSLSINQAQIHTIDADYETTINNIIDAGGLYYLNNTEAVDAIAGGIIKTHSVDELTARTNSGWMKISGCWYYYNTDGTAATGLQKIGSKYYYFDARGIMVNDGWNKINGTWYYLKSSGAAATGWYKVNGTYYYFNAAGAMQYSKWVSSSSTWYYLKASGAMATGWLKVNGSYYYFGTNGAMYASKWVKSGGKWYYLKSNGKMAASETLTISGKKYSFAASGAMK